MIPVITAAKNPATPLLTRGLLPCSGRWLERAGTVAPTVREGVDDNKLTARELVLILISDNDILCAGVQTATRPQAGLSPSDRNALVIGSKPDLLSPEDRGPRALTKGGSSCPIADFPFVPTSIN